MVERAERNSELVADLSAKCFWLSVCDVMCECGDPAADQARLLGNEPKMLLVAHSLRLWEGELGFVDATGPGTRIDGPCCRRSRARLHG